jgi:transcriptional regulator NrdR family protein
MSSLVCPHCLCPGGNSVTQTVQSGPVTWRGRTYSSIRRRRKCRNCGKSFTTTEKVDLTEEKNRREGEEPPTNPFV